ncbi:uncharacterized protein JCM6883_006192 [Sporobolomyces salmoneus]|uniref:uncharacterized protein n=1 Tax=Sporobolomyces salmoneus TaxID=183962 RepID=UPI0031719590
MVAVSPRPLTFALPPEQFSPPTPSTPNFLNRLSRRISQSGANLKRKVSKGGKGPVRRASETDKENRTKSVDVVEETQVRKGTEEEEKPRKSTLKRGLRVSVMRRTKSEGAPQQAASSWAEKDEPEDEKERIEEPERVAEVTTKKEDQSEASSHRGSYFYSNSLGVCWDGRERVHPDAFLFTPYSSNCDVVPSPVIASDARVVYASTLSSFPPRPPLRPRTPPQPTPASQIAAEYRALHPKTPSVYSFSDFDIPPEENTPTNASPSSTPPPPLKPLTLPDSRYSSSLHSSIASSRPSDGFCEPLTPGLSEDSSTSLESLARDEAFPPDDDDDEATEEGRNVPETKEVPRFSLVDSGPVAILHPKPSMVFSEGSSTIDTWRDCEEAVDS